MGSPRASQPATRSLKTISSEVQTTNSGGGEIDAPHPSWDDAEIFRAVTVVVVDSVSDNGPPAVF